MRKLSRKVAASPMTVHIQIEPIRCLAIFVAYRNRLFANARPEADLRYLSNSTAFCSLENAM
jgi:hypothetical protein